MPAIIRSSKTVLNSFPILGLSRLGIPYGVERGYSFELNCDCSYVLKKQYALLDDKRKHQIVVTQLGPTVGPSGSLQVNCRSHAAQGK
jgi:hypothetical protein